MSWLNSQVQLQRPSPSSPAWPRRSTHWPPQRQPSSPPCLAPPVPDPLQPRHETHGGNGRWGQGVRMWAPRHRATPFNPPQAGRKDRESGRGGVAGGHQVLSFPLFFISSLCLCVRAGVPFGPLFSPSLLSVAVSFHTHVHKRTADEHPSSNPSQAVFYRSARGTHTSTHPNTLAGCVLLPCRCLALRLLFKFSFLSEPTSMCAWMPWYHSPGPGAATFLPSSHPCQTNRRFYVLTSCSQREQHAFCLRLFLPLTLRGRLNESVSIVWKRR